MLYLLLAVTGGFSMLYVPSRIVPGDAVATVSTFGELAIILWLLIKGVKERHPPRLGLSARSAASDRPPT